MVSRNILDDFFDRKELAILKLFLYDDTDKFYLREIAKKTKVPVATTFRIVKKFKQIGVIEEIHIKKTKLYSLSQNKNTKLLSELFEEKRTILEEFVETVSQLAGAVMILMHGEEEKDKTNIIVLGTGIDTKTIKDKVGEIKEKYNFNIIELVLEPAQFTQMSSMNLFPNKKTILWERAS
ncbi:MAG: hypothetical protein V1866_06295 [archaeon]